MEDDFGTTHTHREVALIQNVWTLIAPHSNKRCAIHIAPSNPAFIVSFGLVAPTTIPTLLNNTYYGPYTFNKHFAPAITRQLVWGFTTAVGVTAIVDEECER